MLPLLGIAAVAATATASTAMATSEEMEMAAQNYGNGRDVMNMNSQQKITLTRWLSAKVQDYPEVSSFVIYFLLFLDWVILYQQ